MKNRIFFYLLTASIFISCGTSTVIVNVQRPADISVSQSIEKVILANRSTPGKGNIAQNIVEGIFTGEGIGADKKGSEYCIIGLTDMLANSDRYKLKNSGKIILEGTGTSVIPEFLEWVEVNKLCNSYGADALIVLSTFDSDSRIFEGKPVTKTKTINGAKIKEVKYPVTLRMEIESGWRIYDIQKQEIADENTFIEVKEFKSLALNVELN